MVIKPYLSVNGIIEPLEKKKPPCFLQNGPSIKPKLYAE
jgi:hypothetical protein